MKQTQLRQPRPIISQIGLIWQRLTQASPALQKPEEQRQAKLLASILVILIPLGMLSITIQLFTVPNFAATFGIIFGGILMLLIAYLLSRSRYFRWGAALTAIMPLLASLLVIIIDPADMIAFGFLLFGLLLGSMFLPLQSILLLAALTVFGVLLLPFLNSVLTFSDVVAPFTFVLIASTLILLATHHRNLIEQDRQRKLQQGEARYRDLYYHTPVMMHSIDTEGRLISVSDLWLETLGYNHKEVLGRSILDFFTKESRQYAMEKGLPEFWQKGKVYDLPYKVIKKNGEIIDILLTAILQRDEANQSIHSLAFLLDVTKRNQIEQERQQYIERLQILREIDQAILSAQSSAEVAEAVLTRIKQFIPCQRAYLNGFDWEHNQYYELSVVADEPFRQMPQPYFTIDPVWPEKLRKGKLIITDDIQTIPSTSEQLRHLKDMGLRAMLRAPLITSEGLFGAINLFAVEPGIFNDTHAEIVGDIMSPLAIALQQVQLREQIQQHTSQLEIRVEARTKELNERMAEVKQLNRGMLNLLQDMQAANHQLEITTTQLQATNAELEAFAYAVSHDLRGPLRAITGFSQALLEDYYDTLEAEGQGFLNRINDAGQRMGQLIDDLLMLSRITRQEMQSIPVNVSGLVEEIMVQYCYDEPKREITYTITPEVIIQADERLLRIALENLLSNAWKYTSKTAQAHIEFGTIEQDEKMVYFIRDNGVGFDMAYAHKLFSPFQRLHRLEEFAGTGIGLATVQRVIHRHGGQVWAEAEPGKGATFYFSL